VELEKLAEAAVPRRKRVAAAVAALAERRAALVAGRALPEPAELEGQLEDDAEAAGAASSVTGAAKPGVPFFWCSVLSQCDAVNDHLSRRDACALEYLRDVRRVTGLPEQARGVELVFDPRVRRTPARRRGTGCAAAVVWCRRCSRDALALRWRCKPRSSTQIHSIPTSFPRPEPLLHEQDAAPRHRRRQG
jgi:hypothetical protein